jgi:TPR repeat protein
MTRDNGDPSEELKRLLRRIDEMDGPQEPRLRDAPSLDELEGGARAAHISDPGDRGKLLVAQSDGAMRLYGKSSAPEISGKSRKLLARRMAIFVAVAAVLTAAFVLRMPAISIVVIRDGVGDSKSQTLQAAARDPLDADPSRQLQRSVARNQIDAQSKVQSPRSDAPNAIDAEPAQQAGPLLTVALQKAPLQRGQVWPLGVHTSTEGDKGTLVVKGLAADAKLSVGQPSEADGWALDAADLNGAVIIPPAGFIGTMDLTIELRLDGATVDKQSAQIEWLGKTTAVAPQASTVGLEIDDTARLLKRGEALLSSGEIAAARAVFRRLADNGESQAALALAETYEQSTIQRLGAKGLVADKVMAQMWYERAKELGSIEAEHRLEMLVSRSK